MAKTKSKVKAKPAFTKTSETMKHRGIRFTDEMWNNIEGDVSADKTGRLTFSDVVRQIVGAHYAAIKSAIKKPR